MVEYLDLYEDLPLYIAQPESNVASPCVILFTTGPGLRLYHQRICSDLARAGYVSIGLDPEALSEIENIIERISKLDYVDPERIAVIGFADRGLHVLRAMMKLANVKTAVAISSHLISEDDAITIETLDQLKSPVLFVYGELDEITTAKEFDYLKELVTSDPEKNSLDIIPNVHNDFYDIESKNYDELALCKAWMKVLEYLRKYL